MAAPTEAMKMSSVTDEKTVIMNCDTEFIDLLKNVVNYTWAFPAEYAGNFDDTRPKDILQDMMSLSFLGASSKSACARYTRIESLRW